MDGMDDRRYARLKVLTCSAEEGVSKMMPDEMRWLLVSVFPDGFTSLATNFHGAKLELADLLRSLADAVETSAKAEVLVLGPRASKGGSA